MKKEEERSGKKWRRCYRCELEHNWRKEMGNKVDKPEALRGYRCFPLREMRCSFTLTW